MTLLTLPLIPASVMGFGLFYLMIVFVALPLTAVLLILSMVTKSKAPVLIVGVMWLGIVGLVLFVTTINYFSRPYTHARDDIYGEYVIDRSKFPGPDAEWQYDHFRFEITEADSIHFHVTDSLGLVRTYSGTVSFLPAYRTPRIILSIDTPRHHVIEDMPTLYRKGRSFYYVFKSPYYGNVFFRQGSWEPKE